MSRCRNQIHENFSPKIAKFPSFQILQFVPYKALGEVLLDVDHTHFLCKGLESAGVRLAVMLVSAHVTHLRDEVVQWAGRLSRVEEFLTQVLYS